MVSRQAEARVGRAAIRLVVNADDFGYAPGVTRGIVECAQRGIVTSTGIFGNAPDLKESVRSLADAPSLEPGMHFALSHGNPLTTGMRRVLGGMGERFPGKFAMAGLITFGRISTQVVRDELRAQVDAVLGCGIEVHFLNAHEHLHMHPKVFDVVREIACELGVRYVRITQPDLVGGGGLGGIVRSGIIRALEPGAVEGIENRIRFLGLACSGRMDLRYIERVFAKLVPGTTYELMCHPGYADPVLARDEKLRRYHDWDLERRSLQDPRLRPLLAEHGVQLTRFSEITPDTSPVGATSAVS